MTSKSKFNFVDLFEIPSKNGLCRPTKVRGAGVKMVNMKELFENERITNIPMELVPMNNSEQKTHLLKNNDLLFARQSLQFEGAGKCCIIEKNNEKITFESHLIRIRIDETKADPKYIFYFFNSIRGYLLMDTIKEETAATGIRGSDLATLELILPDLSMQKKIANILWVFDNKIQNLKKQNIALEQIVKNVFKSWIIDYDGIEHWEDSELGIIPKGWKVKKLSSIISVTYGFAFKSKFFNLEKGLPLIRIRNLDKNFSNTLTDEKCDKKYHIFSGDVLIGMDGKFDTSIWLGEHSLLNQRVCKLYSKNKKLSSFLIMLLVKQKIKEYEDMIAGTTVDHLGKDDIEELEIIFPSDEIIEKFNIFSDPLLRKIIINQKLIQFLTKTHVNLREKLMSGEI